MMGNFIEKLVNKKIYRIQAKTGDFRAIKEEMVKPFEKAFKVFVRPAYRLFIDDYKGNPKYLTIRGKKLFKLPRFLIFENWKIRRLSYFFRLGEFTIKEYPCASAVFWGKKITIETFIPHTNSTSQYNYWLSILEYLEGQGAHRGNLGKTVIYLGKASMGIQFDEYNPHVMEVSKGSDVKHAEAPNSLYFIVDRSYIKSDYQNDYDFAVKRYNQEESPLMI